MKGPKIVSSYSCECCEYVQYRGAGHYQCALNTYIQFCYYKTPKECPFLIKNLRKEKLQKINKI